MKIALIAFVAIVIILLLWSVWGYLSSRVEQTAYSVERVGSDYEIRRYPAHLVAQTTVEGTYRDALSEGFRIVAAYIFGNNTKKEKIAMTAPVTESRSEKIAMTAPVVARMDGGSHTIRFGMPRGYTLETLPTPNDSRVEIVEVPEERMAVLSFSGYWMEGRVKKMEEQLLAALTRDKVETIGVPLYAGYSAPWTPPWMNRNEVMIEIR